MHCRKGYLGLAVRTPETDRARSAAADAWFDQPAPLISRVVVQFPIRVPIPPPWPPDPFHVFLRPLKRAFEEGNPAVGMCHFVSLRASAHHPMLALMTVLEGHRPAWPSEPNRYLDRRLIVFPGWGDGIVRVPTKGGRLGSRTDHVTFEEKAPGRVWGHLTPLSGEPEEKPYPASPVFLPQGNVLHLCSLRVRQPREVDLAGLVWCRMISPSSLPTQAIGESLHQGVEHDRHALISLPPQSSWDARHHLAVNILLSLDSLEDKDYPIDPGSIAPELMRNLKNREPERPIMTRFIGLRLIGGRHLIIGLSLRSGEPPNSWTLAMSRRE